MIKIIILLTAFLVNLNAFAFIDAAQYTESDNNALQKINPKEAYESYYQINSKDLTPGKVKTSKTNIKNLPQPIFIIGDDEKSLSWLDKYCSKLQKINAMGFIVSLKNSDEYKEISSKYKLPLFPINGDELAKKFNLHHYPVLISEHEIEQ